MISSDDLKEASDAGKASASKTNYTSHFSLLTSHFIKSSALRLGFSACGIAQAHPVDEATAASYRQWIAQGCHADMHYLANNIDKRLDPTLLLPGARSIIVVALNYAPPRRLPPGEYQIADYALGKDYHDVMKQRLRQLWSILGPAPEDGLFCVDTVPILERYWACQAGLGFIGRNHQLIIPSAGSRFFLGEIVTTLPFDHYDHPLVFANDHHPCGNCHRCIDACPTGALRSVLHQAPTLNAHLCLSYQSIEHRGPLSEIARRELAPYIYGCDRCQDVCPWNRFSTPTTVTEFHPSDSLFRMTRQQWHTLTREQYQQLFRGSAVKRAKYEGLTRNIQAANSDATPET